MPLPKENTYTYADLLTWEGDERYELIDGKPYLMSPGPATDHQRISRRIFRQIDSYLEGKTCEPFYAPFDVRLFETENSHPKDVATVVQPDIAVVCDPEKLDERGCKGAPDLIIEILSSTNPGHDRVTKFNLYQQAGVREYWIVSPAEKSIIVFLLEDGFFVAKHCGMPCDKLKVNVLEDCYVDLSRVFPE